MGISVICSECQAKLTLKDEAILGKRLTCPKCGGVFVAKSAPAKKALMKKPAEIKLIDDDIEDYEGEPLAPTFAKAKKQKPSAKKGGLVKKKNRTATPGKAFRAGIIIAIIAGVGAVGYGAFLGATSLFAPRFAYLPDDMDFVAEIFPSRIASSSQWPAINKMIARRQLSWRGYLSRLVWLVDVREGRAENISRIVFCTKGTDSQKYDHFFSVTYLHKPELVTRERLMRVFGAKEFRESEHAGKKYFLLGPVAYWQPTPQIIVAGGTDYVLAAMDGKQSEVKSAWYNSLPSGYDLACIGRISAVVDDAYEIPYPKGQICVHSRIAMRPADTIAITATVGRNVTLRLNAAYSTASGAQLAIQHFESGIEFESKMEFDHGEYRQQVRQLIKRYVKDKILSLEITLDQQAFEMATKYAESR